MTAIDQMMSVRKCHTLLTALLAVLLSTSCVQLTKSVGEAGTAGIRWDEANPQLQFLIRIHASSAAERESMWRTLKASGRNGDSAELRLALLQSVEGHSGHQSLQAESRLRALLQKKPNAEISSVARLRLLELRNERQHRATQAELEAELALVRAQLTKLLQIEAQIDRGRGSESP